MQSIFAESPPSEPPTLEPSWPVHDRFLELRSRWMTLIGEHLEHPQGELLEYWRIEKADSVIILPIQGKSILLPPPSYRPGVGAVTYDFPGGRIPAGQAPQAAAIVALTRELQMATSDITQLLPLTPHGWAVNSSFSNQRVYGFVAHLRTEPEPLSPAVAATYPLTSAGVNHLLQTLHCLQCRAVFLEWLRLNPPLPDRPEP